MSIFVGIKQVYYSFMAKSNSDNILLLLKKKGVLDASIIATDLALSKEGVRQHLVKLLADGLVEKACVSSGVGRPFTNYSLSEKGLAKFPDAHADVSVQLLKSVKNLLGDNALD
ncbi:MAG: helix-turn-helix transcriptional regulator, partial [Sphingobacterium sp.]